jgi:signal transduction histidine kinase
MYRGQHPDAIDTRLIFRVYAWITIAAGLAVYFWPRLIPTQLFEHVQLVGVPSEGSPLLRIGAAVVTAAGCCAAGFSSVDDRSGRRHGLKRFAAAHLVFGALFLIQWYAIFDRVWPPLVGWAPLVAGIVLLYLAVTCVTTPRLSTQRDMIRLFDFDDVHGRAAYTVQAKPEALDALRTQFEEQIRQAARQEERTRLARDLHDAVKQQLFAIQTAAATAETRFDDDADGARAALGQVRASAREAMSEMEAMIAQLEATPLENAGLVEALEKQCEALGFRTGAEVTLDIGALPPNEALPPGAQQALFRAAQEALANVARHARARHVAVALGTNGRQLRLTIRDDGVGFDPGEGRRGMGIRNMTARVGALGGALTLTSRAGQGTTVLFSVPYDATSADTYRTRALGWTVVLIAVAMNLTLGDAWERPWSAALAAIASIAIARYVVAYYRVRGRTGAAA